MPAPASVRIGPDEMALTRMLLRTEVDREIAHRGFQRRLGRPHGVVVRHRAVAAVIGEREHGAAIRHQRRRALGRLDEGKARDQHGAQEVLARRVGEAAGQLGLVGEGDGVDQKIELAPRPLDVGENGIDRSDILDVAGQHEIGVDRSRQRFHPLAERVALVGEGKLGAMRARASSRSPRRWSGRWRPP